MHKIIQWIALFIVFGPLAFILLVSFLGCLLWCVGPPNPRYQRKDLTYYWYLLVFTSILASMCLFVTSYHTLEPFQKSGATCSGFTHPNHLLWSRLSYAVMKPGRGALIAYRSERAAGLARNWRADMPPRYHFGGNSMEGNTLSLSFQRAGRIIGLPNESVQIEGMHVLINGRALRENYACGTPAGNHVITVVLHEDEFLVADDDRSLESFNIIEIRQIFYKAVFSFWPHFGIEKTPAYDLSETPHTRIHLSDELLRKLRDL